MSIKTILVHLENNPRCGVRLDLAVRLARQFDAQLVGLYVNRIPEIPTYMLEGNSVTIEQLLRKEGQVGKEEAANAFAQHMQRLGMRKVEWHYSEGFLERELVRSANYADLIIVGQPGTERDLHNTSRDFPAALSVVAARPVLAVPCVGEFTDIGKNVLIAWNGSRESARAVADALPVLKRAEKVTAITINRGQMGEADRGAQGAEEFAKYLARHEVNTEIECHENVGIDLGEFLLSRVADVGADLIVMGAYGHSRLREFVLGGTTRTLTRSMTVPVLMSH